LGYGQNVSEISFDRVLRGFSPDAVVARIRDLEAERDALAVELAEARDAFTELRLSMVKQVEEASAEAAIVLGHGRSEAGRIRERAIKESDDILDSARKAAEVIELEAEAARDEAHTVREDAKLAAEDIRLAAEAQAQSILDSARARAEHLEAEAKSTLEDAAKRSEQLSSELRIQKQELDRYENEVRDQADSYSLRVLREADAYARSSETRALDVEKQAAEILAEAKRSAHDITSRAATSARKNLEESLRLINLMFSDVSGSLVEVTRIRAVLGDQVERLSLREAASQEITDVVNPPLQALPNDEEPYDDEPDEDDRD
jgi:cell division septum initiation protein DivIVA